MNAYACRSEITIFGNICSLNLLFPVAAMFLNMLYLSSFSNFYLIFKIIF